MLPERFKTARIGLLGFGVNHAYLLGWLLDHGAQEVVVYDEKPTARDRARPQDLDRVEFVTGPDAFKHLSAEIFFRSPGISRHHPALQEVVKHGAHLTSQTELFLELCPARTVGVTGTKGKGTTSSLLTHILMQDTHRRGRVFLTGNIGNDPFEFLDELTSEDVVVLELSSFQLDGLQRSPSIAIVLAVTSDHLDYHQGQDDYVNAKRAIVRFQGADGVAILNVSNEQARSFAQDAGGSVLYYSTSTPVDHGAYTEDETLYWKTLDTAPQAIMALTEFPLRGEHNRINLAAAATAACLLGVDGEVIAQAAHTFQGLPHRLELIGERDGVRWYDDSASTNPEPAIAAIQSFHEPLILIAGGASKGLSYDRLGAALVSASHVKAVITMGPTGEQIAQAAQEAGMDSDRIQSAASLKEAVEQARAIAQDGDVVLLSPASASFDQFANYKERGQVFRSAVGV